MDNFQLVFCYGVHQVYFIFSYSHFTLVYICTYPFLLIYLKKTVLYFTANQKNRFFYSRSFPTNEWNGVILILIFFRVWYCWWFFVRLKRWRGNHDQCRKCGHFGAIFCLSLFVLFGLKSFSVSNEIIAFNWRCHFKPHLCHVQAKIGSNGDGSGCEGESEQQPKIVASWIKTAKRV